MQNAQTHNKFKHAKVIVTNETSDAYTALKTEAIKTSFQTLKRNVNRFVYGEIRKDAINPKEFYVSFFDHNTNANASHSIEYNPNGNFNREIARFNTWLEVIQANFA